MKEDTAHNARIAGQEARAAYDDLCQRTLAKVTGDLNRLIYLASMRDYNSGRYHHAGLAGQFSEEAARQALETAHRELFWKLTTSPLEELVRQLEAYVQASHEPPEELLRTWRTLRPYHVAIPLDVEPGAARLFVSNLKLALEVLQQRLEKSSTHP